MKPLKCVAAYRYGQSPEWWDDWSESSLRLLSTCHLTRRKICYHKTFKIKDKNPSSDATFPQPDLSSSTVGEKWESWTLLLLLCSNNILLIQWCNFHLVTWPCKYYSCTILGEKTDFAIFFFSMIYITIWKQFSPDDFNSSVWKEFIILELFCSRLEQLNMSPKSGTAKTNSLQLNSDFNQCIKSSKQNTVPFKIWSF